MSPDSASARLGRLEFGGALYHVTARGNRREAIYEDDVDREQFLEVLGQVVGQFNWCCHGYCLMSNPQKWDGENEIGIIASVPLFNRRLCGRTTVSR